MAKYSKKSQGKVKRAMHEMKSGKLKSGRSGKKVKSRSKPLPLVCPKRENPVLKSQKRKRPGNHREENQVAAEKSPWDN